MGKIGRKVFGWAARWGFATLVGVGGIVATWVASTVDVPERIPSFALQAAAVYRLEVGAAFFAALYLCSMTLALALNNRAFSEMGTTATRARHLRGDDADAVRVLARSAARLHDDLREIQEDKS
jgi:hypothetical protein